MTCSPAAAADDEPAATGDSTVDVDDIASWASQQADDLTALSDDFVLPDLPSWASQQPKFEPEAAADSFVPPELPSWATPVESEPEADDAVDELSAWASQQADFESVDFEPADFEPEPEAPAAYAEPDDDGDEIDFFSLLETNADANVLLRTGQLRQLDEPPAAPPEPDLSALTGEDSPDDTEMSEDDFYRSFGLTGDDDNTDDKPGGASDDHFYASFNTGGMDDRESDDDDDFFASLGFDNDDLFAEQDAQQPNDALDDDFSRRWGWIPSIPARRLPAIPYPPRTG
ncbi:MAG: hypothetical protein LC121_17880 [Anaerolineae bacterium]|nr:hypothetical protein [Anaerolineae bacterium]